MLLNLRLRVKIQPLTLNVVLLEGLTYTVHLYYGLYANMKCFWVKKRLHLKHLQVVCQRF